MEVHDYEYYEAHAKEVKLEDITSDEYNADILARLRDHEPELKYMSITTTPGDWCDFGVREGDHLGWLGYFVGRNEKLETLYFHNNFPDNINLNALFEGLEHNRSIQELDISTNLGESFQSLIPFMRNNDNLRELRFGYFDIGLKCARNIVLLLSQQSSLKRLAFEEVTFDHEGFLRIVSALRSQPIEELRLCNSSVGRNGFVELGKSLESCSSLRKLDLEAFGYDLEDSVFIDNEGLHALVEGLKHCHKITSLNLYGNQMITVEGLRSLSTLFQSDNCRLEHLDLGQMNIDDDGAAALATGLGSLPSLKKLNLSGMSTGDQGLQDLVGALVNCNLEELYLSQHIHSVSGLKALGTFVQRTTSMRALCLFRCSITDEGLQSFVEGMANCCNLKKLNLSGNSSITANGLATLSSLLQAEQCTLCNLLLHGIRLGDDGAAVLANGLIGNKSLTTLSVDNPSITAKGWASFSKLLCDTSSVNDTYLSNHTLEMIGSCHVMRGIPSDIANILRLNESQNQGAAICKILRSHPDIDITPLFEFNLKCIPLVVEWFEDAKSYHDEVNESSEVFQCRQLSAVYRFIRGMPLVAANGFRSQKMKDVRLQLELKSKKRKLDQTL